MRFMGRLAGAVPRSNSGRASGCVLPFSVMSWDSSTPWVIKGRGAVATCSAASCARTGAQSKSKQTISATRVESTTEKSQLGRDTEIARIGTHLLIEMDEHHRRLNGRGKGGTRSSPWQAKPVWTTHATSTRFRFQRLSSDFEGARHSRVVSDSGLGREISSVRAAGLRQRGTAEAAVATCVGDYGV